MTQSPMERQRRTQPRDESERTYNRGRYVSVPPYSVATTIAAYSELVETAVIKGAVSQPDAGRYALGLLMSFI
jgi:hypothetical protein